jgi:hypothetical protein
LVRRGKVDLGDDVIIFCRAIHTVVSSVVLAVQWAKAPSTAAFRKGDGRRCREAGGGRDIERGALELDEFVAEDNAFGSLCDAIAAGGVAPTSKHSLRETQGRGNFLARVLLLQLFLQLLELLLLLLDLQLHGCLYRLLTRWQVRDFGGIYACGECRPRDRQRSTLTDEGL